MSDRKPIVSIVCLTYNQAGFIRQALDSFIMQKTDFSFEVLIHDDASTDGTISIIQEYAEKYPDIVKPVYEKVNRYSKNDYAFINDTYQRSSGNYIAFCEGDDYWTDPNKLQKQVDYMKMNPDTAVCFHPVEVFFENNEVKREIFPQEKDDSVFTIKELLKKNFIQSNSVLYRRLDEDYSKLPLNIIPSDWYMHLYHAKHGKIGFIKDVMSAYRRHPGGVWWDKTEVWRRYGRGHLELYKAMLGMYGDNKDLQEIIYGKIRDAFINILKASDSKKEADKIIVEYLELVKEVLVYNDTRQVEQAADTGTTKRIIQDKDKKISSLTKQLNQLRNSKSYRVGSVLMTLPQQIKRVSQLVVKQYIPDESGAIRDDRSENLDGLLKKYYQYKPKISGLKVAVVAWNASRAPTSSLFIRLISPLTWGRAGKKINLSVFEGDRVNIPADTDICIVQRTAFSDKNIAKEFIDHLRMNNVKLVVDTDDAFSELDKTHPQYSLQKGRLQALKLINDHADASWVSTDCIAKDYTAATVFSNTLDPRVWRYKENSSILHPGTIKMLYMGTMTHDGDLALVLSTIEKINKKHKDAISLTLIGVSEDVPQESWITVLLPPKERRVYPEFVTWLLEQKQKFDVGIAPLANSEFNKAKSDIKVLDYLAIGVLPIVSDLEPYRNPELDPFIVRVGYSKDDWFDAFEDIVKNRNKYSRNKRDSRFLVKNYLENVRSTSFISRLMLKELGSISKIPSGNKKEN